MYIKDLLKICEHGTNGKENGKCIKEERKAQDKANAQNKCPKKGKLKAKGKENTEGKKRKAQVMCVCTAAQLLIAHSSQITNTAATSCLFL